MLLPGKAMFITDKKSPKARNISPVICGNYVHIRISFKYYRKTGDHMYYGRRISLFYFTRHCCKKQRISKSVGITEKCNPFTFITWKYPSPDFISESI